MNKWMVGRRRKVPTTRMRPFDRAKGFRVTRKGRFADAELIFDGETISPHGKGMNVYEPHQAI